MCFLYTFHCARCSSAGPKIRGWGKASDWGNSTLKTCAYRYGILGHLNVSHQLEVWSLCTLCTVPIVTVHLSSVIQLSRNSMCSAHFDCSLSHRSRDNFVIRIIILSIRSVTVCRPVSGSRWRWLRKGLRRWWCSRCRLLWVCVIREMHCIYGGTVYKLPAAVATVTVLLLLVFVDSSKGQLRMSSSRKLFLLVLLCKVVRFFSRKILLPCSQFESKLSLSRAVVVTGLGL